jgi:tyrosyl-DNA phosphodiesterase 1
MFCSPNQWRATKFPRDKFYDSKSRGGGVLMHSKVSRLFIIVYSSCLTQHGKMIIALTRDEGQIGAKGKGKKLDYDNDTETDTDTDDDVVEIMDEKVGWAYIGSHNFTPSAWGNLSGSSFNPILNVRAFAC